MADKVYMLAILVLIVAVAANVMLMIVLDDNALNPAPASSSDTKWELSIFRDRIIVMAISGPLAIAALCIVSMMLTHAIDLYPAKQKSEVIRCGADIRAQR